MSSDSATYPPDVPVIASAAYDVARGILEAEASPVGTYPDETVECPPIEATPAYKSLIARAELDETSVLVLRLLVAAEIDRGMQRVLRKVGAAERSVGTPVDGVMAIAEGLGADPFAVMRALRPSSHLVARGLVEIIDPSTPALAQRVTVPPRVIDYLATGAPQPPSTLFVLEEARELSSLCPLFLRGRNDLDAANHLRRALTGAAPIWLVGPVGSGRRTLLAAVVGERGARLACTTQRELAGRSLPAVIAACWREVIVGHAVICVHDAEAVVDRAGAEEVVRDARIDAGLIALAAALVAARVPVVFSSTQSPPLHAFEHPLQVFELAAVRMDDAIALWRRELPDVEDVPDLASRFRLPPGRIVRALSAARAHATSYGRAPTALDVTQAISIGVSQQVSILGNRIEDTQTWADIILPADTLESVKEMMARVRHRHQVLDQWGFRGKMAKGLGVAALFHGPPGTGKTMVANLIAKELHQDLYQVDLSRMVSKWIGETEKNLGRVFDAAEGANVMLLFDEADSLFSKRTEVKSSNDRHSNAEINYLLQRVERFEGVCILTTNLEKSIDQAFKRRLAFRIEFPMPDERERTELWKRMVPRAAKIDDSVNFEELAQEYELAGGNIRNALLRAAFLAAEQGEAITMELLHRAVKLEYRDAGKLGTTGTIHA